MFIYLNEFKNQFYYIWLDNLFINYKLLIYLQKYDKDNANTTKVKFEIL